jgi:Asp-tRNA(Asn)/Glu-tRNA(Gln) amidotransferase A subunit family amidase
MAWIIESPLGTLLLPSLFQSAGITWLRKQIFREAPTFLPLHAHSHSRGSHDSQKEKVLETVVSPGPGFAFSTTADYARAYRQGLTDPEQVAARLLDHIDASDSGVEPLRAITASYTDELLHQAQESAKRLRDGKPRSLLEGVPVAVKEELDVLPYPTTVGTAFLGREPARSDASVVARIRTAGALIIGKTNMHEIGIGVTGLNPIHGTPRNPYDPGHYCGGSSGGSAAAVAAGLCPVAIGADGGGSIRIPSAFCGIVGLKPTFGRISESGAYPLCWSVAHIGPLAASVHDAALAYAVMAGPDERDPHTLHQPAVEWSGWDNADLSDLTLGIYSEWFNHAQPAIVAACEAQVQHFVKLGAKVKEIVLPDLEAARVAHTITIISEMAQCMEPEYRQNHKRHGRDVRINLVIARALTARDYIQAQRVRTRLLRHLGRAFQEVDLILTPATGITAPPILAKALKAGESDLSKLVEIMRFATPANLAGVPAISFPAGYDQGGLPIGMQAMGRPWQEKTLLRLALAAERQLTRQKPQRLYPVLPA